MTTETPYTFRDVENQDPNKGVYVRNTGPTTPRGTRERILIIVPKDGMSGQDLVSVPDTDYPWDLTAQVSRTSLLRSSDFRRAVQRGFLLPVNPNDAEEILARPTAQRDVAAILEMEEVNLQADQNMAIDANDSIQAQQNQPAGRQPLQGPNNGLNQGALPAGVNETVAAIMLSADSQTEGMVIASVRSVPNKTVADYEFILTKAQELNFTDLAGRVSTKLAKLRKEVEEDEV